MSDKKKTDNVQDFPSTVTALTINEAVARDWPEREAILDPVLRRQDLVEMYAWRGVGKTHMALHMAYAVSCGGKFLGWEATEPRPIVYVDGEMAGRDMKERLEGVIEYFAEQGKAPPSPEYFKIITPDAQPGAMLNLAEEEGQRALEPALEGAALVVVDNVSTLARGVRENVAEDWQPIQDWSLEQKRKGRTVLFVHHAGKSGGSRGTSKRQDIYDAVIKLQRPEDYSADQGARFNVEFEKARNFYGEKARPFEVTYGTGGWARRDLEDQLLQAVAEYTQDGLSLREIAEILGIGKTKVHKLQKQARESGLID